jgi:hypothetical protein
MLVLRIHLRTIKNEVNKLEIGMELEIIDGRRYFFVNPNSKGETIHTGVAYKITGNECGTAGQRATLNFAKPGSPDQKISLTIEKINPNIP